MKITKTQLKQIIKEEISKAMNENMPGMEPYDLSTLVNKNRERNGPIPEGALIRNSSDPLGISYEFGSRDTSKGEFKYISLSSGDLLPELLNQIAAREDLTFEYFGKEMAAMDFMDKLLKGWYDEARDRQSSGFHSYLPDWVYTALNVPPLEDED